jgi:hypothetical protein
MYQLARLNNKVPCWDICSVWREEFRDQTEICFFHHLQQAFGFFLCFVCVGCCVVRVCVCGVVLYMCVYVVCVREREGKAGSSRPYLSSF